MGATGRGANSSIITEMSVKAPMQQSKERSMQLAVVDLTWVGEHRTHGEC